MSRGVEAVTEGSSEGAEPHQAEETRPEPLRRGACGIPLAVSPTALMTPGGIGLIQEKLLTEAWLVSGQFAPGELDEPTLNALDEVQKREDLPRVRQPTYATVQALGLELDQVFLSGDAACARAQR